MSAVRSLEQPAEEPEDLGLDVSDALFRASADGIVVMDTDRRFVGANPAAWDLLGRPLDKLLGRNFLVVIPEQERSTALAQLARTHRSHPERWQGSVERPDGSLLDVEFTTISLNFRARPFIGAFIRNLGGERCRQLKESIVLAERQRLARELHDSIFQALYGIELGVQTARERLQRDPARVAQPIDHILKLVEASQAEMRALIFELRPESLETEGLVAALKKQIDVLRARHGITSRIVANHEPSVSLDVKHALYRIAQEALHNTIKHAHARRIDVHLGTDGGSVVLEIADDGVGFDPGVSFPGHLGMRSMHERAVGVGGSLKVISSRDHGTRIVATVGLPSTAQVG